MAICTISVTLLCLSCAQVYLTELISSFSPSTLVGRGRISQASRLRQVAVVAVAVEVVVAAVVHFL